MKGKNLNRFEHTMGNIRSKPVDSELTMEKTHIFIYFVFSNKFTSQVIFINNLKKNIIA